MYNLPTSQADSETSEDCLKRLRALADETRWRIITTLARETDKPLSASHLIERLGISSYNMSKHARILREAKLIATDRKGKFVFYSLEPTAFLEGELELGEWSLRFHT